MGNKPTVDDATVREKVREVCNMAPGYGKTEAQILDRVNKLVGGGVSELQLLTALEWNLSKEYVRRAENEDTDAMEWFITPHGIAKERTV
jgi:hypothetical protein